MMPALDVQAGICIRLRQHFRASRERVFRAWTDPEVVKKWWCPEGWTPAEITIDLRAGGSYRIGMQSKADRAPVFVKGHFLEVRAPERLVYTWRWINAFDGMPETCVTVAFLDRDGGTELLLTHENLPEIPVCLRHWNGWIAAWPRIARAIEERG